MVLFDATSLLLLLSDNISPPVDPNTRQPVTHMKERLEHLITQLEKLKEKIVIPTPALSAVSHRRL